MKNSQKNILIAFLLNFFFVCVEIVGGMFTNSVAILSDAIHDFGDCFAVGAAFFLERRSNRAPEKHYTYGYRRYSTVSAIIGAVVLLIGGIAVAVSSVQRIINPVPTRTGAMIITAVFGVLVNGLAARFTSHGDNLNEHTISLHMLEDVLGWSVVLIGSILMHFFRGYAFAVYIDPVMSLGVTAYILYNVILTLCDAFRILLECAPKDFDAAYFTEKLCEIQGVLEIHHLHVWTLDGERIMATLHAVTADGAACDDLKRIKQEIFERGEMFGIEHLTIQIDFESEDCSSVVCTGKPCSHHHHHHH